jgi:hypothetical protein
MPAARRSWVILALGLAAIWLHHDLLLGRRYYFRDTTLLYAPAKFYLARLLKAGVLPQWWPWDGAGAPLLAQPIFSTFHPSTLLYIAFPFWTAFAAQDICGTIVALSGTYLLARSLGQSRAAAVVAGIVFAANGYMMGLTEHQFMKLSASTMPWYWWALLEADQRRGRWFLGPMIAMGLLLLAGDPQVAILATLSGAVVLLVRHRSWSGVGLAVGAPVLGAALAAVQILPSALLAGQTERAKPLISQDMGAFDLAHAAGLVAPIEAGGFAPCVIVGLACLFLIYASLIAVRRQAMAGALWVLVIVSIWLSAGVHGGLNTLAQHVVPFWNQFRYPIKSLVVAALSGALLAGDGFDQLESSGRPALTVAGVLTILTAGATAALIRVEPSMNDAMRPLLISLFGTAIVLLAAARRLRATMGIIAAAQILWFGARVLPTVDASFYDEPKVAGVLRSLGVGLKGPAFERFEATPMSPWDRPYHIAAGGGGTNSSYGAFFGLPTISFYTPGTSLRLETILQSSLDVRQFGRLLGIFGVGYLVFQPDAVTMNAITQMGVDAPVNPDLGNGLTIAPLRRSLGRAYATRRARSVRDVEAAKSQILSSEFKPGREVLIESTQPVPADAQPDELSVPAEITDRTNTSVSVDATLPWPGYVVLNESWFNGWSASVDGTPAPLLVANGFVRAVQVGAGHHQVSFRFETPGLALGAIISFVAWIGVIVAMLLLRRRPTGQPT